MVGCLESCYFTLTLSNNIDDCTQSRSVLIVNIHGGDGIVMKVEKNFCCAPFPGRADQTSGHRGVAGGVQQVCHQGGWRGTVHDLLRPGA